MQDENVPKHIKQTVKVILKDGLEAFGKSRAVYIGCQVAESINMSTHINLNQPMETGQDHDPTSSTSATNTESHDPTSPTSATHTESYNSTPSSSTTNAETRIRRHLPLPQLIKSDNFSTKLC